MPEVVETKIKAEPIRIYKVRQVIGPRGTKGEPGDPGIVSGLPPVLDGGSF